MFSASPPTCFDKPVWTGPGVVGIVTCPFFHHLALERHVFSHAQVVSPEKTVLCKRF